MKYLGIDIGGTSVKLGIVTEAGELLSTDSYGVAFDNYDTPILTTVLQTTDIFLKEQNQRIEELAGIGISATGQIDSSIGKVIGCGGNIKNWLGSEIKKEFEDKYHLKTTVVNDANCVAIGEQWIGRAKGCDNAIVITIGTGVGGGIIVDSKILMGNKGIAGEVGHFSINNTGILCSCGNRGCYEKYASMTALVNAVRDNIDSIGISGLMDTQVNGKEIFDLLRQENVKITEIVNEWIQNIANGLISLTHIFNPEIILIGGGVSVQEDLFINKIRKEVLAGVMKRFGDELRIEAASLGNNAGLVGAVHYCMHH